MQRFTLRMLAWVVCLAPRNSPATAETAPSPLLSQAWAQPVVVLSVTPVTLAGRSLDRLVVPPETPPPDVAQMPAACVVGAAEAAMRERLDGPCAVRAGATPEAFRVHRNSTYGGGQPGAGIAGPQCLGWTRQRIAPQSAT
jgi:hypothetical protein